MKPPMLPFEPTFTLKSATLSAILMLASGLIPIAARAQLAPVAPSQGFQTNEVDNFSGIEQGNFNPMDLIHRASMGPQRSLSEFRQDGQQKLNDAAAQFRNQQLELLQQQRSNNANPAAAESQVLPQQP